MLFWFKDGEEELYKYTKMSCPLAMLLNRLLNETYRGKRIRFFNVNFNTQRSFDLFDKIALNHTHSYGGHLQHYTLFDRKAFEAMSLSDQKQYLWNRAHEILVTISKDLKNEALASSADLAFQKGLATHLKEDFVMKSAELEINGKVVLANLWAEYHADKVYLKLVVEHEGKQILTQEIDSTGLDIEFFYEMYKKIVVDSKNNIVIKGHYDIEYLPLTVAVADKI